MSFKQVICIKEISIAVSFKVHRIQTLFVFFQTYVNNQFGVVVCVKIFVANIKLVPCFRYVDWVLKRQITFKITT